MQLLVQHLLDLNFAVASGPEQPDRRVVQDVDEQFVQNTLIMLR